MRRYSSLIICVRYINLYNVIYCRETTLLGKESNAHCRLKLLCPSPSKYAAESGIISLSHERLALQCKVRIIHKVHEYIICLDLNLYYFELLFYED